MDTEDRDNYRFRQWVEYATAACAWQSEFESAHKRQPSKDEFYDWQSLYFLQFGNPAAPMPVGVIKAGRAIVPHNM